MAFHFHARGAVQPTLRLTLLAAALAGICADGAAQIRTDASLGLPAQTLSGPAYRIPQSLGKLSGANLFHSFEVFNLAGGESATFSTGTAGIANVITRVTGGTPSQINGRIALEAAGGAPAFYFINPAGVTFGAGAAIDVPGAFHAATADYVQFGDGRFHADLKQASTFSSAAPEAFGFLGASHAAIAIVDGARLATADGALSVTGGDVTLDGASLASEGGGIRMAAVGGDASGGAVSVPLSGPLPALAGALLMDHAAQATAGSGAITVSAGSVTLDGASTIHTRAPRNGDAGAVTVAAASSLSVLNGSMLRSSTAGDGAGGALRIDAGAVTVDAGSDGADTRIATFTEPGSGGRAGDVTLAVRGKVDVHAARIGSTTFGVGDAGALTIGAANVHLDGGGQVAELESNAAAGSSGHAGPVSVTAAGAVEAYDGAQIRSVTVGKGNAGAITVRAGGDVTLDGNGAAITSFAAPGSGGNGGAIAVRAGGALAVLNGASIRADSYGSGNAGSVDLRAQTIAIDGDSSDSGTIHRATMVSALASEDGSDAGNISLAAEDAIAIRNGARVITSAWGHGKAGDVSVTARTLTLQGCDCAPVPTGIMADTNGDGAGATLKINVAGDMRIEHGATVSAVSGGSVGAAIVVRAASLTVDGQNDTLGNEPPTGIMANNYGPRGGSIDIGVSGPLKIVNNGLIATDNQGAGPGGDIRISAGDVLIDGMYSSRYANGHDYSVTGISSQSLDEGNGGAISVTAAGTLSLLRRGIISSNANAAGNGGSIAVSAQELTISGTGSYIASDAAAGSSGAGGSVDVSVSGALEMYRGARIGADTYAAGNAGSVKVRAASIMLDRATPGGFFDAEGMTRISSSTWEDSSGNAGSVDVAASGALTLRNSAAINSLTSGAGNAGSVKVAAGALRMGTDSMAEDAPGISSDAAFGSSGRAGAVTVNVAGALAMDGGTISSAANGSGAPGSVMVSAASIRLDQALDHWARIGSDSYGWTGESGSPGSVTVRASGDLSVLNGARISSNTRTAGAAGAVSLAADTITIGGADYGGGRVESATLGNGNAGSISIVANSMTVGAAGAATFSGLVSTSACCNIDGKASTGNGGRIDIKVAGTLALEQGKILSFTASAGGAGAVAIDAGTLRMQGDSAQIRAEAAEGSLGQSGNIGITAARAVTLSGGASIDASSQAVVAAPAAIVPGSITITTPLLQMDGGAAITTTAGGNVAASPIALHIADRMTLKQSSISTSANQGNGGAIAIDSNGAVTLDNALITTSVTGTSGNGGNIGVRSRSLFMNTGFIQANTAADDAQGGLVNIDVRLLLGSGGTLFAGGATPLAFRPDVFSYNVIQAAAPTGVSGAITLASPLLDLSSSMAGLHAGFIDSGGLGRNPCQTSGGSSLAAVGRGGLPRSARSLLDGAPPAAAPDAAPALAMLGGRGCL